MKIGLFHYTITLVGALLLTTLKTLFITILHLISGFGVLYFLCDFLLFSGLAIFFSNRFPLDTSRSPSILTIWFLGNSFFLVSSIHMILSCPMVCSGYLPYYMVILVRLFILGIFLTYSYPTWVLFLFYFSFLGFIFLYTILLHFGSLLLFFPFMVVFYFDIYMFSFEFSFIFIVIDISS